MGGVGWSGWVGGVSRTGVFGFDFLGRYEGWGGVTCGKVTQVAQSHTEKVANNLKTRLFEFGSKIWIISDYKQGLIRPCLFGIISQIVARLNPRLFTHTTQEQSHTPLLELFTCCSTKHTTTLTLQLNNSSKWMKMTNLYIYLCWLLCIAEVGML
jgi:hypothetical protein